MSRYLRLDEADHDLRSTILCPATKVTRRFHHGTLLLLRIRNRVKRGERTSSRVLICREHSAGRDQPLPENTSSLPILPSIVFDGVPPPLRRSAAAAAATAAAPIHRFTVVFTQRRSSPTLQLSAIFPCTTMRADSSDRALRLLPTFPLAPRSSSSACLLVSRLLRPLDLLPATRYPLKS